MRSKVSGLSRPSWKLATGVLVLSAYFLAAFLGAVLLTFLAVVFFFFADFFVEGLFRGFFMGFGLGLAKGIGPFSTAPSLGGGSASPGASGNA